MQKRGEIMLKLTKEEKHKQCLKEIKATLLMVCICFLWHVITAFLLNSTGWTIFHMPAWFVVSVFGTVILAIIGVFVLLKIVFIDFSYDEEGDVIDKKTYVWDVKNSEYVLKQTETFTK